MSKKKRRSRDFDRTVYDIPYFENKSGLFRAFAVRALLSCILSGFGGALICLELGLADCYFPVLITGAAVSLVFSFLFAFFRGGHVELFGFAALGITFWPLRKAVIAGAVAFWNYAMDLVAEGGLFATGRLKLSDAQWKDGEPLVFLLFFAGFAAFITVSCTRKRFYGVTIAFVYGLLMIPAFLAQEMRFYPEIILFIAAYGAFCAINSSYGVQMKLVYGSRRYLDSLDRQHDKNIKRKFGIKRLSADTEHYGKYTGNGVTVFIAVVLVMSVTMAALPRDAMLDLRELWKSAAELLSEIPGNMSGLFNSVTLESDGFFTADSGGNISISGNVNNKSISDSNDVVLTVSLQDPENPVYLRGDVGYIYENEGWRSISDIDYDNIYCVINGMPKPINELFSSYAADMTYLVLRQKIAGSYELLLPEEYIGFQKIIIEYKKNTRTLFMPAYPYEMTFRDSKLYNTKGDFVSWTDRPGAIKRFEVLALYPTQKFPQLSNFSIDNVYDTVYYNEDVTGMSYKSYTEMMSNYNAYVEQTYTDVPEAERENIQKFLDEFYEKIGFPGPLRILDNNVYLAEKLCQYLSGNFGDASADNVDGGFKYSTTVDNNLEGNTYLGNFLHNTKQGHCALFATAMTLAMRQIGVPARYVTGFVVDGEYVRQTDDGFYQYDIKQNQLHAWVEVYRDGQGWVVYDPTPAAWNSVIYNPGTETTTAETTEGTEKTEETTLRTPASSSSASEATTETTTDTAVLPGQSGNGGNTDYSRIIFCVLIAAGAIFVIAAVFICIRRFLRRLDVNRRLLFGKFASEPVVPAMRKMLRFTLKLLRMMNLKRLQGELPMSFAKRVDQRLGALPPVLEIMPLYEQAEFQREELTALTEEDRRKALEGVKALLEQCLAVKQPRRLFRKISLFRKLK